MTPVNTAQSELLGLAAAMRGEDWADDLAGALRAAANDGWDWRAAYREAFRLLLADDGHPQEIRDRILRKRGQAAPADGVPAEAVALFDQVRARHASATDTQEGTRT